MTTYQSLSDKSRESKASTSSTYAWIFTTFFAAFLLNVGSGALDWVAMPDFLALNLIYWTIYRSRSIGMFTAFICGLLMDVQNGSVLGQQALAYVTLSYLAFLLHRRIPWFGLIGQALHVLPLLLIAQLLVMLIRVWFDGLWPGFIWFSQSLTGFLFWPVWYSFASYPQWLNRRYTS